MKQRQFLIDARLRKELSQQKVADHMGISQQAVSEHERGGKVDPYDALKYIDLYDLRKDGITLEDFYRD